jgi:hypothetical protein
MGADHPSDQTHLIRLIKLIAELLIPNATTPSAVPSFAQSILTSGEAAQDRPVILTVGRAAKASFLARDFSPLSHSGDKPHTVNGKWSYGDPSRKWTIATLASANRD